MEAKREPSIDPVKLYLNEIGQYPLLDKEEEFELGVAIQDGIQAQQILEAEEGQGIPRTDKRQLIHTVQIGETARQWMANCNLRLVVSIAKKYKRDIEGYEILDRIQEGNRGLIHAVEKFDPYKGFKFSTYSTWWIRQAIDRGAVEYRAGLRIPINAWEEMSHIKQARDKLRGQGLDGTSIKLLAEETGLPEDKVALLQRTSNAILRAVSFNQPVEDASGGEERELETLLPDPTSEYDYEEIVEDLFGKRVWSVIMEQVKDQRDADILYKRYYEMKTLDAIGQEYGLTRERIRQLERNVLNQLRNNKELAAFVLGNAS